MFKESLGRYKIGPHFLRKRLAYLWKYQIGVLIDLFSNATIEKSRLCNFIFFSSLNLSLSKFSASYLSRFPLSIICPFKLPLPLTSYVPDGAIFIVLARAINSHLM